MSNQHVKINQHLLIVNLFFDIIFVMFTLIIVVVHVLNMLKILPSIKLPVLLEVVDMSLSKILVQMFFLQHDLIIFFHHHHYRIN